MPYSQNHQFERKEQLYGGVKHQEVQGLEGSLLEHVLAHSPASSPKEVIASIDDFCNKTWMMSLGAQKGLVVKQVIQTFKPKTILELGAYTGYSSLFMAYHSGAQVHSIQISKEFASIAARVHEHAGVKNIHIHIGITLEYKEFLVNHGPFDLIFIDHDKNAYLPDLKLLQEFGAVGKHTVVIGDNMIYPGSPDYLAYFKQSEDYDSTLYYTNLEFSDQPDAILVSKRIA